MAGRHGMFVRITAAASLLLLTAGCSILNPAPVAAPADPYANLRPTTAAVGVTMPALSDFQHPWDVPTYIMRVTLFAGLPPMNGGVAFVGDSITDYGRWSEAYPNLRVRNFGIAGDTTVGLEHRLIQVIDAKPATIFLMIGTNDVEFGRSPEQIAANIGDILDRLVAGLPNAKVYLESLMPRQPEFDAKVRAVNALLQKVAAKRGLTYIDLYTPFLAGGNRLDPRVTVDDLHPAGEGYARWRALIKDDVYPRALASGG
ncbi:MAG: hypothetical protein KGJ79_11355 [Alphaproteobacteria bacterium]|nr:hypothetical protein [Alphaproteobacteria bacterium]MDE2111728.1 hypothetical protein [Alphaproteobacteria bacterium]MDE2496181.1 hypothetical protein [Alphaproteobacteria bacterium]